MATFKITSKTTVSELKQQFQNEVGGVLRVYEGRSQADDGATLVSLGAKEGEMECRTSRTVGSFEKAFQDELNLKVKVYTKDNWVAVLEGVTLATVKDIPNSATKTSMQAFISNYSNCGKVVNEEKATEKKEEAVEIPEEYIGLPLIEIKTKEIDIDDTWAKGFPKSPTVGVIFHGYESNASQGCVLLSDTHDELCERAKEFIENEIADDEDIPVSVVESVRIVGYGENATDVEELSDVIGCALNELYDGGNKHSYEYEWPDWFSDKAIFEVDDDVFIAYSHGGIEFVDLSNAQLNEIKRKLIKLENTKDYYFYDGETVAEYANWRGIINKEGEWVVLPEYKELGEFYEGKAYAKKDNKFGYIDRAGNVVIPFQFDDAYDFHDGVARVEIDQNTGYIDSNGKFVLKPIYQNGKDYFKGKISVELDDEWFYIDLDGNKLDVKEEGMEEEEY